MSTTPGLLLSCSACGLLTFLATVRQCAPASSGADSYPPAVSLRPSADWPDRALMAVDLARVRAVIGRIAADVAELARAWRVQDLNTAAVYPRPATGLDSAERPVAIA